MTTSDNNLTTSNHYLVNTESDVSEITDQLSDSTININNDDPATSATAINANSVTFVESIMNRRSSEIGEGGGRGGDQQQKQQEQCHSENEMPLSFASFYYSLKVIKGKG